MSVVAIDLVACINCGWCRRVCPTETIKYFATGHRTHIVEPDGCIDCGICAPVCPVKCIHPVTEHDVAPDLLSAAKAKAKTFAAKQRKMKQDRDVIVERTLARLASIGGAPASNGGTNASNGGTHASNGGTHASNGGTHASNGGTHA